MPTKRDETQRTGKKEIILIGLAPLDLKNVEIRTFLVSLEALEQKKTLVHLYWNNRRLSAASLRLLEPRKTSHDFQYPIIRLIKLFSSSNTVFQQVQVQFSKEKFEKNWQKHFQKTAIFFQIKSCIRIFRHQKFAQEHKKTMDILITSSSAPLIYVS